MPDKIDKAIDALAEAKAKAAIGAEFAPDYVEVKGVKIWYKTVAHAWVISYAVNSLADLDNFTKGVVTVYILANSPENVRNKVMQEIREGVLAKKAFDFFIGKGLVPEDLEALSVPDLLRNPYAKN